MASWFAERRAPMQKSRPKTSACLVVTKERIRLAGIFATQTTD